MTLFDRVNDLAKKQGMSVFDLSEKLGLSRNAVYSWKKSSPKGETLDKVADYFDVSVDYLLGRTDDASPLKRTTANESEISDADLEDVLDDVMSWNGIPLTEQDKEAVRIFMAGRKSK